VPIKQSRYLLFCASERSHPFRASTRLLRRQEGHLTCKNPTPAIPRGSSSGDKPAVISGKQAGKTETESMFTESGGGGDCQIKDPGWGWMRRVKKTLVDPFPTAVSERPDGAAILKR